MIIVFCGVSALLRIKRAKIAKIHVKKKLDAY